jgi:hypothetical protein
MYFTPEHKYIYKRSINDLKNLYADEKEITTEKTKWGGWRNNTQEKITSVQFKKDIQNTIIQSEKYAENIVFDFPDVSGFVAESCKSLNKTFTFRLGTKLNMAYADISRIQYQEAVLEQAKEKLEKEKKDAEEKEMFLEELLSEKDSLKTWYDFPANLGLRLGYGNRSRNIRIRNNIISRRIRSNIVNRSNRSRSVIRCNGISRSNRNISGSWRNHWIHHKKNTRKTRPKILSRSNEIL